MKFIINKDQAFNTLSEKAQLYIRHLEATDDVERFLVAIRFKNFSLIKFYIDAGINLNDVIRHNPLLIVAAQNQQPIMVKILLDAGAYTLVHIVTALHAVLAQYVSLIQRPIVDVSSIKRQPAAYIISQLDDLVKIAALIYPKIQGKFDNILKHELSFIYNAAEIAAFLHKVQNIDISTVKTEDIVAKSPEELFEFSEEEKRQISLYRNGKYDELSSLRDLSIFAKEAKASATAPSLPPKRSSCFLQ